MSSLSKDVLRDCIKEQNSKSPDEIFAMKEMLRDVL